MLLQARDDLISSYFRASIAELTVPEIVVATSRTLPVKIRELRFFAVVASFATGVVAILAARAFPETIFELLVLEHSLAIILTNIHLARFV